MTISALQKRISVGGLFKNLLFVYLGNLIGAIFVAVLFVYGHIPSLYGGDLAQVLLNTAVSKVTLTLPEVLCRAVLCNVLVCIAVWAAMSSEQVSGKILALYPPVAIFILCGFEHCVANMYFFTIGGVWSLRTLLYILVMTLGNSVGGLVLPLLRRLAGDARQA